MTARPVSDIDLAEHTGKREPGPEHGAGFTTEMYEAAFSTQGSHPMGGVAMARTLEEARQQLANVLIFADPTAPATRRSSPSTAAYP